MRFDPRPFQSASAADAVDFLLNASSDEKRLYKAPTGVGKSIVELMVRERFPDMWWVSPRDEIIDGMLDKLGLPDGTDPWDHRISTPIKLRNALLQGRVRHPTHLGFDEAHHEEADSWQDLGLLCGLPPAVGYTATPYRGTPASTRKFLKRWGDPVTLITFEEACREGYISNPTYSMLPLVDDDVVDVRGGEFEVTSIDAQTVDRLGDMAEHAKRWYDGELWDRPTVFAMPSSACCVRLSQEMARRGLPCAVVAAGTPKKDRKPIFQAVVSRVLALLHINIVSEGVDLPIRRLVDLAPTLSPIRWVQQLGRATRPVPHGEPPPEYVCTNRNILRHAYALEGAVPLTAVADCDAAFPEPSSRPHVRALGLEAIGRFKPTAIKLANRVSMSMYNLSVLVDGVGVDYCVLVHPTQDPFWAVKVRQRKDDGTVDWGRWRRCDAPEDLRGFGSVAPKEVSPKQRAWWDRSASLVGLDPAQELTRKNFQVLPVMFDTGWRP